MAGGAAGSSGVLLSGAGSPIHYCAHVLTAKDPCDSLWSWRESQEPRLRLREAFILCLQLTQRELKQPGKLESGGARELLLTR